jgi:short-subunit dehydrogenase
LSETFLFGFGMFNKSILITGCSEGGIGHTVASVLQSRGYRVFATARNKKDVAKLSQEGFESHVLDVCDSHSIVKALEWTLEATNGTLYALFNNGAYGQPGALEDISSESLKAQFESNFFGWHELVRRVIPIMRTQGYGRIIQHGSILGLVSLGFRGAYNASKYALEGYTDTLRLELSGSGVYVSILNTGPIRSQFRINAMQAFEAHVDAQKSVFAKAYHQKLHKRLQNLQKQNFFEQSPNAVARVLIHALESSRPKPRYYITTPSYCLAFLKRIFPTIVMDKILLKISDISVKC